MAIGRNANNRRDDFHPDHAVLQRLTRSIDTMLCTAFAGDGRQGSGGTFDRDGNDVTNALAIDAIHNSRQAWFIGGREPGHELTYTLQAWRDDPGAVAVAIAYRLHRYSFLPTYGDGSRAYAGIWILHDKHADTFRIWLDATTVHDVNESTARDIGHEREQLSVYDAIARRVVYV